MTTPASSLGLSLDAKLHAIADPARRRILAVLKRQRVPAAAAVLARQDAGGKTALCAGDIEAHMGLSQSTISHHMSILTKAGLVEATKQGQWRWYRRNEKALRQLVKSLRREL